MGNQGCGENGTNPFLKVVINSFTSMYGSSFHHELLMEHPNEHELLRYQYFGFIIIMGWGDAVLHKIQTT